MNSVWFWIWLLLLMQSSSCTGRGVSYTASTISSAREWPRLNCPHKRLNPIVKLKKQEIVFPEPPCQRQKNMQFCERCSNTMSGWEVKVPKYVQGSFTLSLLMRYKCIKWRSRMNVLYMKHVKVEIHCQSDRNVLVVINDSAKMVTIEYDIEGRQHGTVHIIIVQDTSVINSRCYVQVFDDGNSSELESTSKPLKNARSPLLGKNVKGLDQPPSKSTHLNVLVPFTGSVEAADILNITIPDSQLKTETQYMSNLVNGLPYPECLCSEFPTDNTTCSDGSNRLTGDRHEPFTPLQAIADGIIYETESLNYGFWETKLEAVTLYLKLVSNTAIESVLIWGYKQSLLITRNGKDGTVYLDGGKSGSWSNLPDEPSHRYLWKHKQGDPVIVTDSVNIIIHGNIETSSNQTKNRIFEIIIDGSLLHDQAMQDGCTCFPGNGNCCSERFPSQCICRNEVNLTLAGTRCIPFVSSVYPSYGPRKGGIQVTIKGRLLKPSFLKHGQNPTISLGDERFCSVVKYEDELILCELLPVTSPTGTEIKTISVKMPVDDENAILESGLRFTYKDPLIIEITPRKAFLSRGQTILIKGYNLEVIIPSNDTLVIKWRHVDFGKCEKPSSEVMVCQVPKIDSNTMETAHIEIKGLDQSAIRGETLISFYVEPDFEKANVLDSGAEGQLIQLEGHNLMQCCSKFEYNVQAGGSECKVTDLMENKLLCRAQLPGPGEWKIKIETLDTVVGLLQCTFEQQDNILGRAIAIVVLVLTGVCIAAVLYVKRSIFFSNVMRKKRSRFRELDATMNHKVKDIRIPSENLDVQERIGKGNTGFVYRGSLKLRGSNRQVALKMLRECNQTEKEDLEAFLNEAAIMKDFDHPNVLSLIGVVLDDVNIYVVLPFMPNGDLRSFLEQTDFDLLKFTGFALDVARGMDYLSDMNFIHRDLAARNCMVDAGDRVYVGDFGLTRDLHERSYYQPDDRQQALPYKWMAIESLRDRTFTTKSDVWSFGVVMWEIFSKGVPPYCYVETSFLSQYLEGGHRLEKPRKCPKILYVWMTECWEGDPDRRPTFNEMVNRLQKSMTHSSQFSLLHIEPTQIQERDVGEEVAAEALDTTLTVDRHSKMNVHASVNTQNHRELIAYYENDQNDAVEDASQRGNTSRVQFIPGTKQVPKSLSQNCKNVTPLRPCQPHLPLSHGERRNIKKPKYVSQLSCQEEKEKKKKLVVMTNQCNAGESTAGLDVNRPPPSRIQSQRQRVPSVAKPPTSSSNNDYVL